MSRSWKWTARCCGERAALRRRASPTLKRWIRLYSSVSILDFSKLFFLGDDLFHDFRRARADRVQTEITPHAPDRILRGVSKAAEDLHAVISNFLRELGRIELGHGDLTDGALTTVH